ncbi:MAG: hypothetical protein ACI4UX_03015 [Clostridia bacterium]
MKKVIIGILIGIVVCVICVAIYVKYFMFVPDKNGMINENAIQNEEINDNESIELEIKTNFSDNQCLAIGYILDSNIDEFIDTNFYTKDSYNYLKEFDFRTEESKKNEQENKFVIIPKTKDVKISVYTCSLNNDGEIKLANVLIKDYTEPFIIIDDYLAETTTPEICIRFEHQGFEEIFPIVFSGMDGKLDLTGVEQEVKDISVY